MRYVILLLGLTFVCAEDSSVLDTYASEFGKYTSNVYKEISKAQPSNFIACPFSVQVGLAMAYMGAKGNTATEMAEALHIPADRKIVKEVFQQMLKKSTGSEDYQLNIANKIYVKDTFNISDSYRNDVVTAFHSEIENINFDQKSESAKTMNKWVEEKTHDKIKNLINAEDLNEDTRAVLLNAVYYHGKWVTQFDPKHTASKAFHINTKEVVNTDMMEVTSTFKHYKNNDLKVQMLEIPYKGTGVSMTIVLPDDVEGLAHLELTLEEVIRGTHYSSRRVHLQMPKFKAETKIDFKEVFQRLGMNDAFEDNADFTDIGSAQNPIKISKIVQKAFIEVEEKGTTAAAATAVFAENIRSAHVYIPPVEFNVDHPFIYYLKTPAGLLFMGRYVRP